MKGTGHYWYFFYLKGCSWKGVQQGCFLFHYFLAPLITNWVQISIRFVILCECWDTPNENSGLWQLLKLVSCISMVLTFLVIVSCFILQDHPCQAALPQTHQKKISWRKISCCHEVRSPVAPQEDPQKEDLMLPWRKIPSGRSPVALKEDLRKIRSRCPEGRSPQEDLLLP